jgi:hypothetical protein
VARPTAPAVLDNPVQAGTTARVVHTSVVCVANHSHWHGVLVAKNGMDRRAQLTGVVYVSAAVTSPLRITVIEDYLRVETRKRILIESISNAELRPVIVQISALPHRKSRLTTIQMGP